MMDVVRSALGKIVKRFHKSWALIDTFLQFEKFYAGLISIRVVLELKAGTRYKYARNSDSERKDSSCV